MYQQSHTHILYPFNSLPLCIHRWLKYSDKYLQCLRRRSGLNPDIYYVCEEQVLIMNFFCTFAPFHHYDVTLCHPCTFGNNCHSTVSSFRGHGIIYFPCCWVESQWATQSLVSWLLHYAVTVMCPSNGPLQQVPISLTTQLLPKSIAASSVVALLPVGLCQS